MLARNPARAAAPPLALLLTVLPLAAIAGTTGKISGTVRDRAKQPLAGVNVIVVGAPLGAATDADGRYVIVNVPAGLYAVKASMIGYRATTLTDVCRRLRPRSLNDQGKMWGDLRDRFIFGGIRDRF